MKCLGKLKLKSLLWGSLKHSEIYFAIALLCKPDPDSRSGKTTLYCKGG